MRLPSPIRTYFDADNEPDGDAPLAAFAIHAVVEDEGRTYRGREAIDAWWRAAKARTKHRAEPFAIIDAGDAIEVRAKVTGEFPGSPADLTFAFRLEDGAIAGLRIGA